jgi:hypothetical protein
MKEYLHGVNKALTHVYFPTSGFCSVVTVLMDGRMVEVATIGREGAIGSFSATSGERPSRMVVVQANWRRVTGFRWRRFSASSIATARSPG